MTLLPPSDPALPPTDPRPDHTRRPIRMNGTQFAALLTLAGGTVLLFWVGRGAIMPFAVAASLSFVLMPLTDTLHGWVRSRTLATLLTLLSAMLFTALLVLIYIPSLIRSIQQLIATLPELFAQGEIWLKKLAAMLNIELQSREDIEEFITQSLLSSPDQTLQSTLQSQDQIISLAHKIVQWLITSITAWTSAIVTFLLVILLMFYFLRDWPTMIRILHQIPPPTWRKSTLEITHQINTVLAGFVRGQLGICAILAVSYSIALILIGHPQALAVGLLTGLLALLPVIGTIVSALVAIISLLLISGDWVSVLLVLGVYLGLNVVENAILVPQLIGASVQLHPLWVLFTVIFAGSILGILGIIIALPMAACIGVLVRRLIRVYTPQDSRSPG